jgi:hypothetical protein
MGVYGQRHDPAALPSGNTHCMRVGWAPRPVWMGAENLASTEIPSPDRPARSGSLTDCAIPALSPVAYIVKIFQDLF